MVQICLKFCEELYCILSELVLNVVAPFIMKEFLGCVRSEFILLCPGTGTEALDTCRFT